MSDSIAPAVSIIIISYNTRDLTLRCLKTLRDVMGNLSHEIWLVDNDSADDTLERVRAEYPEVLIIDNKENQGFGRANNQAMERARGRYFLLLNSDAFPFEGAVQKMFEFMESNPDVSLVGPRVLNGDGSLQRSINEFYSPLNQILDYSGWKRLAEKLRGKPNDALKGEFWLGGMCLFLRRDVWEKIGGFDPDFFFYGEDCDWQKRMRTQKMKIAYLDESHVTHLQGGSGAAKRLRTTLWYYTMLDLFIWKHYGFAGGALYRAAVAMWCARKLAFFHARAVLGKPNDFAVKMHGFLLRHTLSTSKKMQRAIPK
ncbi:glycosyltransferase family 2 protein [bacterium]|nr:MAG: glycosyltransferase family 2 protein [bacterium]